LCRTKLCVAFGGGAISILKNYSDRPETSEGMARLSHGYFSRAVMGNELIIWPVDARGELLIVMMWGVHALRLIFIIQKINFVTDGGGTFLIKVSH
jgi:hypothetical protein